MWSVMDDPEDAFGGGPADAVLGQSLGEPEGVEAGLGALEADPEGDDEGDSVDGTGLVVDADDDEGEDVDDDLSMMGTDDVPSWMTREHEDFFDVDAADSAFVASDEGDAEFVRSRPGVFSEGGDDDEVPAHGPDDVVGYWASDGAPIKGHEMAELWENSVPYDPELDAELDSIFEDDEDEW